MFSKFFSLFNQCKNNKKIDLNSNFDTSQKINPTERCRTLSKKAYQVYKKDYKSYLSQDLTVIGFPEYKVTTSQAATTSQIECCCVTIIYSDLNDKYAISHYNSATYHYNFEEQKIGDDFQKIFHELGDQLNSYKAIIIGGNLSLFKVIEDILNSKKIPITSSYCDDYNEKTICSSLMGKYIIFNKIEGLTIFSSQFPKSRVHLSEGEHLTLTKDFSEQEARLKEFSNDMMEQVIGIYR